MSHRIEHKHQLIEKKKGDYWTRCGCIVNKITQTTGWSSKVTCPDCLKAVA